MVPFEESLRSDCESFDDEPGSNAVPACSFYPPAILTFLSIPTSPLHHLLDEGVRSEPCMKMMMYIFDVMKRA